jgi:hypothetical protein
MTEAWHALSAWPEVARPIQSVREDLGQEVFVHANGQLVYSLTSLALRD